MVLLVVVVVVGVVVVVVVGVTVEAVVAVVKINFLAEPLDGQHDEQHHDKLMNGARDGPRETCRPEISSSSSPGNLFNFQ